MRRSYANGMDWVAAGLGAECAATPGGSNHFLLLLTPAGRVEPEAVRALLGSIPEAARALLHGRWVRAWHLAPYWKPGPPAPVAFSCVASSDWLRAARIYADEPLPPRAALAVRVIDGGGEWRIAFKFSHRLFDGGGAELFLKALFTGDETLWSVFPGCKEPGLNRWGELFGSGTRVNRALRALSAEPISELPNPEGESAGVRFRVAELDAEQIKAKIGQHAGPFMFGTAAAALIARAFDLWRRERFSPGRVFFPMSIDMRLPGDPEPNMWFNQWSCLPLWWEPGEVAPERAWWIAECRRRMLEAMGAGLPKDFRDAYLLMRILPVGLEGKLAASRFRGGAGSAMFSLIPASSVPAAWEGREFRNLVHLPVMPPRPALGIFCNVFADRLNLVLSWRGGLFRPEEADGLLRLIRRELQWEE